MKKKAKLIRLLSYYLFRNGYHFKFGEPVITCLWTTRWKVDGNLECIGIKFLMKNNN